MTGWGKRVSVSIMRLQSSNSWRCQASSPACARISLRSCPAEKPRPFAASTITRTAGSAARPFNAASIAAIIAEDSGFEAFGLIQDEARLALVPPLDENQAGLRSGLINGHDSSSSRESTA